MIDYKLNPQGIERVTFFKKNVSALEKAVDSILPNGNEKDEFKKRLLDASFWGVRAVSSDQKNHSEKVTY